MRLTRWIPTFLAVPLAGLITIETVGSFDGAASGAAAGLLAGAIVGGAQWLALRSAGIGRGWIAATLITGLVLRRLLPAPTLRVAPAA